jgi:hypothetical protein
MVDSAQAVAATVVRTSIVRAFMISLFIFVRSVLFGFLGRRSGHGGQAYRTIGSCRIAAMANQGICVASGLNDAPQNEKKQRPIAPGAGF